MGLQSGLLESPFVINERALLTLLHWIKKSVAALSTSFLVESCSGVHFFSFFILCSQTKNFPRMPSCRPGSNSPTNRHASSGKTAADSFLQASIFEHSSPQKPRILQLPKQVGLTPLSSCMFSVFGQAAPLH